MTKAELLNDIKKYNSTHDNRLKIIENTIRGINGDSNSSCVKLSDCSIDIWMRQNEQLLIKVFDPALVNELYLYHEEWHDESARICEVSANHHKKNSGLFKKLLGTKDMKMQGGERDMALAYLDHLKELTGKIGKIFDKMQKRVAAMPEEMFPG